MDSITLAAGTVVAFLGLAYTFVRGILKDRAVRNESQRLLIDKVHELEMDNKIMTLTLEAEVKRLTAENAELRRVRREDLGRGRRSDS